MSAVSAMHRIMEWEKSHVPIKQPRATRSRGRNVLPMEQASRPSDPYGQVALNHERDDAPCPEPDNPMVRTAWYWEHSTKPFRRQPAGQNQTQWLGGIDKDTLARAVDSARNNLPTRVRLPGLGTLGVRTVAGSFNMGSLEFTRDFQEAVNQR